MEPSGIAQVAYEQVPQGLDVIDDFCLETLYDAISQNLDAVNTETLLSLGKPDSLMNKIYVFRMQNCKIRTTGLPVLPRQGLKQNGKSTEKTWNGYSITKRTFTIGNTSLWEYIYKNGDNDWIILHRYAPKGGIGQQVIAPQNNQEINQHNNNNHGQGPNNNITGDDNENNRPESEAIEGEPNYQDNSLYYNESNVNNTNNDNSIMTDDYENSFNQHEATGNQNNQQHEASALTDVDQCTQIILHAFNAYNEKIRSDDEVMEDVDGLLPDVPSSVYFKLLRDSISEKKFFNKPITIYEQLFKFKLTSDDTIEDEDENNDDDDNHGGLEEDSDEEIEEDIISFWNLTQEDFKFIVDNKLIHLTSPAGTGKTMTMWQLAKSVNLDFREKLVPITIKAEHYYHQIMLEDQFNFQFLSIEALIRGSMHTAEVRKIQDQQAWCQNLEATIRNGTGVVLLIDALDEMKSRDREEFLKHIQFLTANIPGVINGEVNLKAIVVSSRPGLTLPTDSEDLSWQRLELCEQEDSAYVLQTLCEPESAQYKKALELCEHYEFPKYLFWYSLLVIEAGAMDETSPLAASQFDFLGGLLLRSIKTTKDKKPSLDADQSAMLNEESTYLLLLAGLIAYISKVQQTTTIADLERELWSLMTESFPKSITDSRGSVIKKLLPVLQFCHCCTSCTEDSEDKMIVFDHQIVFDYLVASFIVKTIVQKTHPSLSTQINNSPSLTFDWQYYVKDTAHYDSEWVQVMHLIADALPVRDFITTIKKCTPEEAEAWLSGIAHHPRCYDIEDPTFAYIKLVVSCLFNASRKSVAKTSHKKKKSKTESSIMDDSVTRLSFEVLINLFSQPLIGQLIIEEICQIKSLSLLFTELTQQNLHDRFIQLFIDKFNAPSTSEQRMPEELVTLAIRLSNQPEINLTIQEGLFNRLSLRCDTEPTSSPVMRAIHSYFKKTQAFDYLIDKLAGDNELAVASALPILLSFNMYHRMHFEEIYALLMNIAQNQALTPEEANQYPRPPNMVLRTLLECGTLTWLEIKHACRYFDNEQFAGLKDAIRYYNSRIKEMSLQTREVIIRGNFDSLSRKKSETFLAFGFKGKATAKGIVHEVTQEQKQLYLTLLQVASMMVKARDEHKPLADLVVSDNEFVPVCFQENTIEEALALLYHRPEKITRINDIVKHNLLMHRLHMVQLVADNVLAQLFDLIDQLTNEHIIELIDYANYCFCYTAPREEWYPVINYNHLEKLLAELCDDDSSFQWRPETVIKLWEFLGTDCYQFYLEEFYHDQVFPDLIEKMTDKWSTEEACEFLAAVMEMDLKTKLQYDVMQMIARLTVEE